MARGNVYTDTDILKLFEAHGELTVEEVAESLGMSRSASYPRINRLRKQGKLEVARLLPSTNSGRPTKVYAITGKHRPSIINDKGEIVFNVPSPVDQFNHVLTAFDVTTLAALPPHIRQKLFRSLTFKLMARAVLTLRSREHKAQYLAQRDTLVKEGEELVQFLKGLIDSIESTIYSPEFRDPISSNFTNIAEDYHQWAYDHLEEYKPIMLSEALRDKYLSGHLLPSDYEEE